jgi:NadR type nicotinamide-nucleotide adenylyltransferase
VRKIVIIGPESTGKTTLAAQLAEYYNTKFVPEFAREYLKESGANYTFEDVLNMAQGQHDLEQRFEANPLFFDTNLYVFKVWIEEKYQTNIEWIEQVLKQKNYEYYLLCDIDLPWQPDPLREHPNPEDRQRLFNRYKELLEQDGTPFSVVSGKGDTRLKKTIEILEGLIRK